MLHITPPQELNNQSHKAAHVLIVDDDATNCFLLEAILNKAGFHSTTVANNDAQAHKAIAEHTPDLILLDIVMPGINGLELCKTLKKAPRTAHTPVIFLSGLEGVKVKTKAFDSGGVDYITKPYHKQEVLARVTAHLRNGLVMKKLSEYNTAIKRELTMAEHFQRSLLPTTERLNAFEENYNLNMASAYHPCSELAGDYWAFLPINRNTFGIILCDYSGHGVPAALETVRFHSLLHEYAGLWGSPLELIQKLNKRLAPQLGAASFATLQYAVFDTAARTVNLWGAGTPPLLQLHTAKNAFSFHGCEGFPIGIDRHTTSCSHSEFSYEPNDIFLFYSDALSEAPHKAKGLKLLKAQSIKGFLDQGTPSPEYVVDELLKIYLKAPKSVRNDDLTLVAIQPY